MQMKKILSLTTDRKSASEGEFIEIRWNCDACPDSLLLTIDSGYKCDTIAVADSGSTRIMMSRSKGKTVVSLKAVISGKKVTESVDIRIKNSKNTTSGTTPGISKTKIWKEKIVAKWYVFRAQMKYWWLSQKKWQKALWITLLALWLGMMIASFANDPKPEISSGQIQTAACRPSFDNQHTQAYFPEVVRVTRAAP